MRAPRTSEPPVQREQPVPVARDEPDEIDWGSIRDDGDDEVGRPEGPLEERRFSFVQQLDAGLLAERIASVSFVAAAPLAARRELDAELRRVAERLGGRVDFPYLTTAYVSFAV